MELATVTSGAAALLVRPQAPPAEGEAIARVTGDLRRLAHGALHRDVDALLGRGQPVDTIFVDLAGDLRARAERDQHFRDQLTALVRGRPARPAAQGSGQRGDGSAPRAVAQALHQVGDACRRSGCRDAAIGCYRECHTLLRWLGDRGAAARCLNNVAAMYEDQGRVQDAAAFYAQSHAALEELGDRHAGARVLVNLGRVQHLQGRLGEAAECFARAAEILGELGDRRGAAQAQLNAANLHQDQGRHDDAAALLDSCQRTLRELGAEQELAHVQHNLATVAEDQGRWDLAGELYAQSAEALRALGDDKDAGRALHGLGRVRLSQHRWDEARGCYRTSAKLCGQVGDRRGAAEALHQLGLTALQRGELPEARAHLEQGLALFQECRTPLEDGISEAKVLAVLGLALFLSGDRDAAFDRWHEATTIVAGATAPEADELAAWLATWTRQRVAA
ncbi:MAG: tetratricopeptide repeat protein [Actinomycetota bacterium]|nr:tetratricopeptide repeat protein [Actinomycetota bacterium]